jgi:hypothetical protein
MANLTGVAAEWSAREYGGRFQSSDSTPSVGTSVSTIVQNNPERVNLLIINLSANTVYIRPNGVPSATAGIVLAPSGGSFSTNMLEDLVLPSYAYSALATGAASALLVIEVTRYAKLDTNGGSINANL